MATSSLNIIRGSDKTFTILVTISGGCNDGSPFDLTGATEIIALFENADTTILEKTMTGGAITILSAPTGKISVTIADAETALLNVGQSQSFELEIHIGPLINIVQFVGLLNVTDRVFSTG